MECEGDMEGGTVTVWRVWVKVVADVVNDGEGDYLFVWDRHRCLCSG